MLGLLVLAGGIVLAVVLLVRALRRVRASTGTRARADTLEGRTAASWRSLAEAHEHDGEWRDALRCHYRALLAELVAAERVEEVPGRTPREYLAAVSEDAPAFTSPLEAATDAFEAAWYGHQPVGPDDVEDVRARDAEIRALLGSTTAARGTVGTGAPS
ncbi:DUF4129 domain-containing protein [Egibacter rhizosphaerae]|uniref:DUF4129 domain-containing protein n=1 Tax=Egibacter rhizosphaerae TaxID=1670831 RepID=A0A411YIU9_9ACTN|nr:DUF4129 domain-containing protein [Egibacter rhizosphaerae]QBI21198.1 DUF4129 domain-containing protein [Egibacter rhizosphaerae]